jgi:hypothetical protein
MHTSMTPYSKTVYSVVWPETEAHFRAHITNNLDTMLAAHQDPHLKSQDGIEDGLALAWKNFVAPFADFSTTDFPNFYPLAGSSEGIREIIGELRGRGDLVVFDGDYEGYSIIAEAGGTPVWRVGRSKWRDVLGDWHKNGAPWGARPAQWWISQPSSIDGNQWPDLNDFLDAAGQFLPSLEVWWDAAYAGAVAVPLRVPVLHPVISGMVFSLSKSLFEISLESPQQ